MTWSDPIVDEVRRARMPREDLDDFFSVPNTARVDFVPENVFFAENVNPRSKHELAAHLRTVNAPPRKRTRDFLYISLCITAIDPQRVQFHQLASVVFVDSFDRG